MTDLLQVLQESVAATEGVIARIDPSAWEQPNPNPGWSNQDALDHLVKVTALIAKAFGAELGEHCSGPAAAPDFGEVAAKMLGAMKAPGAFDGVATLPWGEAPRASVLPLAITEVLLHGWDLAAGTDQAVSWGRRHRAGRSGHRQRSARRQGRRPLRRARQRTGERDSHGASGGPLRKEPARLSFRAPGLLGCWACDLLWLPWLLSPALQ